jgi:ribonuclease HI
MPPGVSNPILVFSDGASSGNPGPGGWGAVVALGDGDVIELGGAEALTTSNRMEMTAVIEALQLVEAVDRPVTINTDSSYLVQGMTRWLTNWKRRGWQTVNREPVLNQDLWLRLDHLASDRVITWTHVPGHRGIPGNERADRIATGFAKGREVELYVGPEADYPLELRKPPRAARPKPQRKSRGKTKAHAYLSLVDGEWRRHASWPECERRVKGVSGARFQKVLSEDEIEGVLKKWGVH